MTVQRSYCPHHSLAATDTKTHGGYKSGLLGVVRKERQQDFAAGTPTRRKPLPARPPSSIIHFSRLMEQIHVTFKYTPFSYFGPSSGTRAVFRVCRGERRNKMMGEARGNDAVKGKDES